MPYHTTDTSLNDYFKQFGEIEEAVVITDRQTQKSRGYGFVSYFFKQKNCLFLKKYLFHTAASIIFGF